MVLDRPVNAIAKGHGDPAVLGPHSTALAAERTRIPEELTHEPPAPKDVALHPTILKRYEEQLERLEKALAKGAKAGDAEAAKPSEIWSKRSPCSATQSAQAAYLSE
ncbi:hypothetical protein [Bradyrhizobium roseum]|uniref:hypothetical protein n=1 Tax=Bradyrhizobium roseum TaxID=3056648 RepID=UPI0026095069|nr:hypothetical protein [Bradyrhizobium roseus]WKA30400.1 hypothetical protein QUH67_09625 [Bradyrhizobium roseus]